MNKMISVLVILGCWAAIIITGLICATVLAMNGNWVFASLIYLASFLFAVSLQIKESPTAQVSSDNADNISK